MKRSFVFAVVAAAVSVMQAANIGWGILAQGETGIGQWEGCFYEVFMRHVDGQGNVRTDLGGTSWAAPADDAAAAQFLTSILDAEGASGSDLNQYVFGDGTLGFNGGHNQSAATEGHQVVTYSGSGSDWLSAWYIIFDTGDAANATQYAIYGPMTQEMTNNNTSMSFGIGRVNKIGEPMPWRPIGGTPVPEPVAAALLALGVAAFGLKRKACK